MMTTPRWFAIVVALSAVLVTATAQVEAADPGVRILAGEKIAATVPSSGGRVVVNVLNGTMTSQRVTVAVVGLPGIAAATGAPVGAVEDTFDANEQQAVELPIPAVEAGTHVASVVAYGADGTSDARQLELTVKAPSATTGPSVAPGTVALPLPPKVVVVAELMWPTPISDLQLSLLGTTVRLQNQPLGDVYVPVDANTAPKVAVSLLQTADGRRATATMGPDRVVINGLAGAGQYDGTMTVGEGADADTTPITVVVRDQAIWALVVLFAGLWLASKVNDYLARIRPRNAFRVLVSELGARTTKSQATEAGWWSAPGQKSLREWVGKGGGAYRIYDPTAPIEDDRGALFADAKAGLQSFDDTGSTEDRPKRFARDGSAFAAIEGDLTKLEALYDATHRMATVYLGIAIREGTLADQVAAVPAVIGAREVMAGQLLKTRAKLDEAATSAGSALTLLARFASLAAYFATIQRAHDKDPQKGKVEVDAARTALLSPGHRDLDSYKDVEEKLDDAWAAVTPLELRRAEATGRGAPVVEPVDVAAILASLGRSEPVIGETAELRRDLRRADRLFDLLAGLLTIASGLSLLYFSKGTFGSTGDYLGLFVWGTATKEVLSLARRFGPFSSL
jgi:hypothetical protein